MCNSWKVIKSSMKVNLKLQIQISLLNKLYTEYIFTIIIQKVIFVTIIYTPLYSSRFTIHMIPSADKTILF